MSGNKAHLIQQDAILGKVIQQVDALDPILSAPLLFPANSHQLFHDLMSCIIEQQIHYRSSKKTFQKMLDKAHIKILSLDNFEIFEALAIQHSNLSTKKYESILSCVAFFEQEQVHWSTLSDKAVRKTLKAIKGVGNWTMDMILLYSLERPNIFPIQDYHLKKVIHQLYPIHNKASETQQLRAISEKWSGQASVAVKYLWAWKTLAKAIHPL